MKIAKALKMKNQLAGEVAQLKDLLAKQNSRSTKQKFDYDNREVLTRLRAKLDELVKVKAAVAAANVEIYDRIFRLAELKGLATTLNALDTKAGVFHEGRGFADASYEVEYVAQLGKVDVDKLVAELNAEIQSLQDALDEFNFTRSVIFDSASGSDSGARWWRNAADEARCQNLERSKRSLLDRKSNYLLMLMPSCQTTSVSSFKMQAAARKAQAS